MKRIDYYIILATLLISGGVCLYAKQESYAGMFLGIFFAFIKDLLHLSDK